MHSAELFRVPTDFGAPPQTVMSAKRTCQEPHPVGHKNTKYFCTFYHDLNFLGKHDLGDQGETMVLIVRKRRACLLLENPMTTIHCAHST